MAKIQVIAEEYTNLYKSYVAVYIPPNLDPEMQKDFYIKAKAKFEDLYLKEVREVSNCFKMARAKTDAYIGLFEGANWRESLIPSDSSTQIGNITVAQEPKLPKIAIPTFDGDLKKFL